jgi:glycosyltransferase involved in cell wall biosynthesis
MLNNKTIAVIVPAYNEEQQIAMVLETMPDFVDRIIVVNDCSNDRTEEIVKSFWKTSLNEGPVIKDIFDHKIVGRYERANQLLLKQSKDEINFFIPSVITNNNEDKDRIVLINHKINSGVGAAIARGYKWCKDHDIDCSAVMAGDGQMDPAELLSICNPIIYENIDYSKGNRLIHRSSGLVIPKLRFFGNSVLSILTKLASGYWRVSDTQTGFTAISNKALNAICLYKIYKDYGMPNDMLVKLNIAVCTVKEVEIKPVYDIGEHSKMKIMKVVPRVSWLLFISFFKRIWQRYFLKDFHPLFLLYHLSILLAFASIPFLVKIIEHSFITKTDANPVTVLAFVFLAISSFQSLMFAMWMDIQDNDRLYKN